MNTHVPAPPVLKPSQVVAEYDRKAAAIPDAVHKFEAAAADLKMGATIGGTWGELTIDTGRVCEITLQRSLLKSAWRHVYQALQIKRLASASERRRFEQAMADPAPFTIDNIRATFGHYIADPHGAILRGLAEVFCDLDPAYKSHEKMKIGVKGLPKRIILNSVTSYGSWGRDRLENVLNALAVYQGKPLVSHRELTLLCEKDGDVLINGGTVTSPYASKYDKEPEQIEVPALGVWLRRFRNGNGHLFFAPEALKDINLALAEFYGDVLPDCADDDAPVKRRPGTAVSKDLQYYPTPVAVVDRIVAGLAPVKDKRVLEPSCGCGRFLDALRAKGARCVGFEVDPGRAELCRQKGHSVQTVNFLETAPTGDFDQVVMNPPFYGQHYVKHVEHAAKFLKPGGCLTAILPITARHDHGVITEQWAKDRGCRIGTYDGFSDLPVGSFSESGTNINTTVLTMWRVA